MVGELLGHFRVIEQVGAGGMGVVYRGRDERLDRDVALKVLPTSLLADSAARRRFRQEALALSRLNHPNIATVHDFVTENGLDILVMEFVPGITLSERLKSGPLPQADVVELGMQLAAGVQCAHAAGVIHRDLKPGNLRLTDDGRLKILDFGLARLLGPETSLMSTHTSTDQGRPAGTLQYMAPEQLRGEPPGVSTDIYSAGATLYELATGHPPFRGTQLTVIDDILHRAPEPPSAVTGGVSAQLDAVLLKALDKSPKQRYASAQDLSLDLQGLRGAATPQARISRRGVLLGLAAAALAGVLVWNRPPSSPTAVPFQPRGWVLIADFENRSADPALDRVVPESLAIALHQSAFLNVVSRERQFEALKRMKRPDASLVTEDVGLHLCRREGIPVLLAGSVAQSGGATRIVVRALETKTGTLMFAETAELQRRQQLFGEVDKLAKNVRSRLGESVSHIHEASAPLEQVTTGSLEALRRYSQGNDAFMRGELERAVELLEGALILDGDFAMAHRVLARVYSTIGNRGKELEHFSRAFELRNTVSVRERHLIEGSYLSAREQYEDAAQRFSRLVTLYPDDIDARYELARARYATGDINGTLDALRENLRLHPAATRSAEMLVPILATSGSPEDALKVSATATTAGVSSPRLRWGRGMAQFVLGRLDDARHEFQGLEADGEAQANIGRLYLARTYIYEGRLREASEQLKSDIRRDRETGRTAAELLRRYLLGRIWLLMGRRDDALHEADAIASAPAPDVRATNLQGAALLYVWSGRPEGGRLLLTRLLKMSIEAPSSFTRSCMLQVRGEVALHERRYPEAVDAFNEAAATYRSYLSNWGLARTYRAAANPRLAADAWQDVIGSKGEILRDHFPADWVTAHYEAAQVFVQLGEREAARTHLRQFLGIWQSSSTPEMTRLAENLRRSLD